MLVAGEELASPVAAAKEERREVEWGGGDPQWTGVPWAICVGRTALKLNNRQIQNLTCFGFNEKPLGCLVFHRFDANCGHLWRAGRLGRFSSISTWIYSRM